MYEGYKKNRHGMPQELAAQMPIIKEVLHAMNIETMEKADYEGDDILEHTQKSLQQMVKMYIFYQEIEIYFN